MKKNHYYQKGRAAAKKKQGRDRNPYRPVGEVLKQLRKNTLWILGYEDVTAVGYETEKLKKQLADNKKKHKSKHKSKSHGKHK
jgi:hypothetical protein